ncbi:hypothetical protein L5515_009720 [Caenorhabditis briggsae]|uniref:Uncharacterized protein n=1 Tax=Caenorhabditis briggsae TaxID=6238 RepID=A0AAE9F9K6_CAEBR|nr:hypothetical protein L5515_009720 [Caenorhabditis briggsae]
MKATFLKSARSSPTPVPPGSVLLTPSSPPSSRQLEPDSNGPLSSTWSLAPQCKLNRTSFGGIQYNVKSVEYILDLGLGKGIVC